MGNNFIPITDIIIPEHRQRKEHDPAAHNALVESIKENGLLNAINLRPENGAWLLVAGERRLRAIADLYSLDEKFEYSGALVPTGCIPFTPLGELSPLEIEVLELEENIRRKDLTWQEQVAATGRIADIRAKQASNAGTPAPKTSDIAEEVHGETTKNAVSVTRQEILLAKHLDNPIVQKAKSRDDAFKALVREEQKNKNIALAESIGASLSSKSHTLIQDDCFNWMAQQPDGIFDVVLTDPPYGMGADAFGKSDRETMGDHFYEDSPETVVTLLENLPSELYRLTKPDAHLYLFCDIDYFRAWRSALSAAGWKVFRTPLIWFKSSAFRAPWPEHGPQRKYETIVYAIKGDKKCTRLYGDVIECQPETNLGHPAQKPVGLFTSILQRSCIPGNKVFDPFCGSGPIFEAAHVLSCQATGIEQDAAAAGIAAGRLDKLGEE